MLFENRHCWKDSNDAQPVSLWNDEHGEPTLPVVLKRDDLYKALPQEELLDRFQGHPAQQIPAAITVHGKRVCPLPLTWVRGLREALQWQTDLDAWRMPPFDGPTGSWPAGTLDLLRHIRGINGLLQSKRMEEGTPDVGG